MRSSSTAGATGGLSVSAARAECVLLLSLLFVRDQDERTVQSIGLRRCPKEESTEQSTLGISISVLCDSNAEQEVAERRVELMIPLGVTGIDMFKHQVINM